MKIVYDERKRQINIEKHGIDFTQLDLRFFAGAVVVPAKIPRLMAIGPFAETIIAVVFLPLGTEGISIISARRATRKERSVHASS